MLRFSTVEERRLFYKASPADGPQYCLQVIKNKNQPTTNGMRVRLMPADANYNTLQLWSPSPDDRILLASDPTFCLHVVLDTATNTQPLTSTNSNAAFNGAHLCVWTIEKHIQKQAQQLWLVGPDDRIRLSSHRQYCIMLWNGICSPGNRVDLWKTDSDELVHQQFISSNSEVPYLRPATPEPEQIAAQEQMRNTSSARPKLAQAGSNTSSTTSLHSHVSQVSPVVVKTPKVEQAVQAVSALHKQIPQLLSLLEANLSAGHISHAHYLNLAEKLTGDDSLQAHQAAQMINFYHKSVESGRINEGALGSTNQNQENIISHALRQLEACLSRNQITREVYADLKTSLTLGDSEEQSIAIHSIEQMTPQNTVKANWNELPQHLWVHICSFLVYTETALLSLVSKPIDKACSAQEIWKAKCEAFFSRNPAWKLPEKCNSWKHYMNTYFTKWVPLEREKQKGQRVYSLRVAVRFKPLPNEEQPELRGEHVAVKSVSTAKINYDTEDPEEYSDMASPNASMDSPAIKKRSVTIKAAPSATASASKAKPVLPDVEESKTWTEIHQDKCEIVEVSELHSQIRAIVDDRPRDFKFSKVFSGTTTQQDLYTLLVWTMTRDVMFGYSATIFVYGQTASGKTWTMFGPSLVNHVTGDVVMPDRALWGVVPRACDQIITTLNQEHGTIYTFEVSYVEIYQDRIYDLLNGGNRLQLIEDATNDRDFKLDKPRLVTATSMNDVVNILSSGEKQKTVFATQMNERSSRSHCLFTITLTQYNAERNFREKNKYNLVDLAGSERQKKSLTHGKRFEEAKNINKSLATLERCILCLSDSSTLHIPYRDSELTKMLQQALGGYANCKRTLLVTCSRDHNQILETLSTLRFAERARGIQITQNKKKAMV